MTIGTDLAKKVFAVHSVDLTQRCAVNDELEKRLGACVFGKQLQELRRPHEFSRRRLEEVI